jgi:hypothetical protein
VSGTETLRNLEKWMWRTTKERPYEPIGLFNHANGDLRLLFPY